MWTAGKTGPEDRRARHKELVPGTGFLSRAHGMFPLRQPLGAWIIMFLWNWIAVSLFNAPVLNIWLALGLSLLCSMLFKSSSSGKENEEK